MDVKNFMLVSTSVLALGAGNGAYASSQVNEDLGSQQASASVAAASGDAEAHSAPGAGAGGQAVKKGESVKLRRYDENSEFGRKMARFLADNPAYRPYVRINDGTEAGVIGIVVSRLGLEMEEEFITFFNKAKDNAENVNLKVRGLYLKSMNRDKSDLHKAMEKLNASVKNLDAKPEDLTSILEEVGTMRSNILRMGFRWDPLGEQLAKIWRQ